MTGFDSKRQMAQAKQEPTPWRDMVVVTLVREGIDKHKARELADHFAAAQPEQEPVAYYHPHKGFYWAKPTHISAPTVVDVPPVALYTTPPQRKPLTDERLKEIWYATQNIMGWYSFQEIARAIEAAHNIGEKT